MIRICLLSVLALKAAHGMQASVAGRFSQMGLGGDSSQPSGENFSCAADAGYKKGKLLGKGKSGNVYQYTKGGEKYAVKRSTSKKYIADCVKESKMLIKLHDIGISDVPRCFGLFKDDKFVEVVMDIARGQDLKKLYGITLDEAQQILRSVATVLASIHANGMVHNDLHNGNVKVYLSRKGVETKTIDWGDVKTGLTKRGEDARKFAHMAAFTFNLASRDGEEANAARAVMNSNPNSLDYLYNFTRVHMWRNKGELWTPIYDERQDKTGSGWEDVEGEHYPEDGACYNIFRHHIKGMRKIWTPTNKCRECRA